MNEEIKELKQLNFSLMVKVVRKNIKLIAIAVIIMSIITVGLTFIFPYTYVSKTTLMPSTDNGNDAGVGSFLKEMSSGISLGGIGKDDKTLLYIDILGSQALFDFIDKKLNLSLYEQFKFENRTEFYEAMSRIIIADNRRSGVITIHAIVGTVYLPNAKDKEQTKKIASDIANTAAKGLNLITKEKTSSSARQKRIYIERVLKENIRELDSIDNELKNFRTKNNVLAIDDQAQAVLKNSISVGSELLKAEIELNLAKQDYAENSPLIKGYREKVNELRDQYQRVQSGGMSDDNDFSIPLDEVPQLIKEYTTLMRDQEILESVRVYLETQKYQSAIQEESDVPTIQVLDQAYPPDKRYSPNRAITLLGTVIITSLLGMVFVVVRASIKSSSQ